MNTPLNFEFRIKKYPELQQLFNYIIEPEYAFSRLIELRDKVPEDMYAYYLRGLYQANTLNVPLDTILKAFEGLKRNQLMDAREVEKFNKLPNEIIIYRGKDYEEKQPRLSWTLDEEMARKYCNGKLFKAIISKEQVIAYFISNTDENEILAYLNENYINILN